MAAETEKLVALCQQLQAAAKTPAQGKTATFQKVWELQPCVPPLAQCLKLLILKCLSLQSRVRRNGLTLSPAAFSLLFTASSKKKVMFCGHLFRKKTEGGKRSQQGGANTRKGTSVPGSGAVY